LTPSSTVLEELERAAPELGQTRLRTILGTFLFSGDAVEKKIAVLSGGEKARVALAKMLVRPAALLCLDEPTNHLDLASREVLEGALAAFPGTIVFISHDRYFINRIATEIVEIGRGALVTYRGSYDDYLDSKARAAAAPAAPAAPARPAPSRERAAPPAEAPPASRRESSRRREQVTKDVRELRRRLEEVERQIHALEARLAELGERLGDPALYANGERVREATAERKRAEEQVMWLMREWEQLSTALATHE
jgi:ATP-binding cassette subfamily F protein 3